MSRQRLSNFFPALRLYGFLLIFFFGTVQFVSAQGKPATDYQVKAAYLFNFTRFVDWPNDAFRTSNSPFVIGIVGHKDLSDYLAEIVADEKIDNHPIRVRFYRSMNEVEDCNILFLNATHASMIREGVASLNRRSILTVSDAEDFLHWGGTVRFYNQENKIRIQINAAAARTGDLQISSKLLSVATKY